MMGFPQAGISHGATGTGHVNPPPTTPRSLLAALCGRIYQALTSPDTINLDDWPASAKKTDDAPQDVQVAEAVSSQNAADIAPAHKYDDLDETDADALWSASSEAEVEAILDGQEHKWSLRRLQVKG